MDDEAISLTMSHDGRFFATGGTAAIVKLWGYDGPSLIAEGFGHSGVIKDLRYASRAKHSESVLRPHGSSLYPLRSRILEFHLVVRIISC